MSSLAVKIAAPSRGGFELPVASIKLATHRTKGVPMFFRKRPLKAPIEIAIDMISHATIIAYGYKHNTRYMPSEHDLRMFDLFADELWQDYCTERHIQRCLYQRFRGEPESPPQWHHILIDR